MNKLITWVVARAGEPSTWAAVSAAAAAVGQVTQALAVGDKTAAGVALGTAVLGIVMRERARG